VEFDRVRSHPGLAVVEIEERDARYPCSSAQAHMVSCYAHLAAPKRSRVLVAARRRRLGDHVIAARLKNNVQVGVAFGTNEHHRGNDGEDVMLERQSCSGQM